MLQKINFKATLDFLSLSIHTLDSGFNHDLDSDLFLDKLLEDLLFIDSILSRLFHQLRDNPYLNRRVEYLTHLEKTKEQFIQMVSSIVQRGTFLAEPLEPYLATFRTCLEGQAAELVTLRSILQDVRSHPLPPEEEVVSPLEYQFLLHQEELSEGDDPEGKI